MMVGPGQLTRNLSVEKMETSPGSSGDASSTVKIELNSFNEIERNEEIPSTFEYKSQEKADADSTAGVYKEIFGIFWNTNFLSSDLGKKMSNQSKSFRDQDLLTDVTLVIGTERLRAHKILLCKFPYFQKMFCSRMSELKQEVIPINLNTGIDEPMADASCFKVSSRISGFT